MAKQSLRIDRVEGSMAICENEKGDKMQLAVNSLPAGAKEGDCLRLDDDGTIAIDTDETRHRRELIKKLQQQVFSEE